MAVRGVTIYCDSCAALVETLDVGSMKDRYSISCLPMDECGKCRAERKERERVAAEKCENERKAKIEAFEKWLAERGMTIDELKSKIPDVVLGDWSGWDD